MFLFRLCWFFITGVFRLLFIVAVGYFLISSTTPAQADESRHARKPVTQEQVLSGAEEIGQLALKHASLLWNEINKYEIRIIKHDV